MVQAEEQGAHQELQTEFDLNDYLAKQKILVETALDKSISIGNPSKIYESMRYSLLAGGKRLRPILCLATCELMGGKLAMAMPTACALEMIHTMSLIHDDLPSMDNDDYRRGKLTNHKVYGDDIAILAGDGLLAYAFEYVAMETKDVPCELILQVVARLGKTVGAAGLVGGQVLDLESEGKTDITAETLSFIHTHKTGALLETSVVTGAVLAGASEEEIARLSLYAQNIGLAFQIVDDILDYEPARAKLGKEIGDDFREGKMTAPILYALENATEDEKVFWNRTLSEKKQKNGDLEQAQSLIEKHNALNKSKDLARQYGEKAVTALSVLPNSPLRDILTNIVTFTINRTY